MMFEFFEEIIKNYQQHAELKYKQGVQSGVVVAQRPAEHKTPILMIIPSFHLNITKRCILFFNLFLEWHVW